MVDRLESWDAQTFPRRAALSSFGIGGTNAHAVLEEFAADAARPSESPAPCAIVLSARNQDRLLACARNLTAFIREKSSDGGSARIHLADLAYTLQVGRKAMDARLGLVAGSLQEAALKLQHFVEHGAEPSNGLAGNGYRGQAGDNADMRALFADDELQKAIDAWIQDRNYDRLLALWVKGVAIDWHKLYGRSRPRRISLPTYPFAQQCFRLDATALQEKTPSQAPAERLPEAAGAELMRLAPVWNALPHQAVQHLWPAASCAMIVIGAAPERLAEIQACYPQAQALDIQAGDTIEVVSAALKAVGKFTHVLFCAPASEMASAMSDALIREQHFGVLRLFRLVKALLALGRGSDPLGWTLVTARTRAVASGAHTNPAHAAVHGFARAMAGEYPAWRIRCLDLAHPNDWPVRDMFRAPADAHGALLVQRGGEWLRQSLIPVRDLPAASGVYRPKGVYVVIGGAGGLGEAWTRYMLEKYQARVVSDRPARQGCGHPGPIGSLGALRAGMRAALYRR